MLGGTTLALALALLTYRHGPVLTFDGYHYCEFAKRFAAEWPDRFGNHWPFGYPLLGGLLGRVGVPGYPALVLCSLAAVAILARGAARVLHDQPHRWVVLAALLAPPALAVQLLGNLTELPLAAVLLALALALARWPQRWALWSASGLVVLALAFRYAGLIAHAILVTWLVVSWARLRERGRCTEAVAAVASALVVSAGLLLWNLAVSGHASGAGRGASRGLVHLPEEMAQFGWSAPSALLTDGVRRLVEPDSAIGLAAGGAIFAGLAALSLWSWFRPASGWSRPLALTSLGYAVGMAVLHCIGDFDALYNARTYVPALVPFGLLLAERGRCHPRLTAAVALGVLAVGVVAAARGLSRGIAGDVRPALAPLRGLMERDSVVGLNDHAFSLSAYLAAPTRRVWPENLRAGETPDLVVIAAPPQARDGTVNGVEPAWRTAITELAAAHRIRVLHDSLQVVVVSRVPAAQPGNVR